MINHTNDYHVATTLALHNVSNWSQRSVQATQESLPNLVELDKQYILIDILPKFDEIAKALQDRDNLVEQGKFSSDQVISIA